MAWAPASTALALDSHRSLTNDIARYWPDLMEQDSEPAGTSTDIPWLPSWLPIAHDLGGNYLFLDLREGPAHGCVGERYNDDTFVGEPEWWSVADMLADVADALTNDTDINGWYAEPTAATSVGGPADTSNGNARLRYRFSGAQR